MLATRLQAKSQITNSTRCRRCSDVMKRIRADITPREEEYEDSEDNVSDEEDDDGDDDEEKAEAPRKPQHLQRPSLQFALTQQQRPRRRPAQGSPPKSSTMTRKTKMHRLQPMTMTRRVPARSRRTMRMKMRQPARAARPLLRRGMLVALCRRRRISRRLRTMMRRTRFDTPFSVRRYLVGSGDERGIDTAALLSALSESYEKLTTCPPLNSSHLHP